MNFNKQIYSLEDEPERLKFFQELFFKYHGRLVLFANKFTCDMQIAQDLVQDAFLKLWEKPGKLSSVESPKAYLFQAVRNNCLNNQRHLNIKQNVKDELKSKLNALEQSAYFESQDPLNSLFEKEIEQKVEELVQAMPEKCRQVFIMSRREYLKNKEISQKLGISEKMVEKHISKALYILRSGLSKHLGMIFFFMLRKNFKIEGRDVSF